MQETQERYSLIALALLAVSGIVLIVAGRAEAQPGVGGYALKFDGVDDAVVVPGFGAIAPTTEITVEFWQKADAATGQFTFALSPDNSANRISAHVPWSDGKVYWDFGNSDSPSPGRLGYLPPEAIVGSWQHFALTASQSGNYMRIYRNGVLEATRVGMDPFESVGSALSIGGVGAGISNYHFGGLIDEFRIWNIARNQAAIQSTMNTTLNGDEPGLLAYWPFDEGMDTTAADLAGNSDGTLTNGPI
jgi:hypothetical protein